MLLSSSERSKYLLQAEKQPFDLVVIGGGITGAGVALDAVLRGLRVLLCERKDFAFGTSSRSTKLIHGGLRYLKNLEFDLVRRLGIERAIVHRLARHLTLPEKMLTPIVANGTYGKWLTAVGIGLYDYLANVPPGERRKMLSVEETLVQEPLLRKDVLKGAALYYEYRTDDARLTIEVIKTAVDHGAMCFNYLEATNFLYEGNSIKGVECFDAISEQTLLFKTKTVVNAAGPWVDTIREKNRSLYRKHLLHTKGVHLVVPHQALPVKQAVYFDVFDGRMIFVIPRASVTYIGTTDTPYTGSLDRPTITSEDARYLLKAVNTMMPEVNVQFSDILSGWVGLRPLIFQQGKTASEISRKDEIFISKTGLISIAGGKLTGYRKMSEKVVDVVMSRLQKKPIKSQTHTKKLNCGKFEDDTELKQYQRKTESFFEPHFENHRDVAHRLVHLYGMHVDTIIEFFVAESISKSAEEALLCAELMYSLRFESVQTLCDFVIRRTGMLYFDPDRCWREIDRMANYIGIHLNLSAKILENQKNELFDEWQRIVGYKSQKL